MKPWMYIGWSVQYSPTVTEPAVTSAHCWTCGKASTSVAATTKDIQKMRWPVR